MLFGLFCFVFFFKQKTAYELRISDWSSDVCSSDLAETGKGLAAAGPFFVVWRYNSRSACAGLARNSGSEPASADASTSATPNASTPRICVHRSEERRGGKECGSTWRSRWSPYH